MKQPDNQTILLGVPKVGYGIDGVTPYPICLKALAAYLGQKVEYDTLMVETCAAFRLTWNTTVWDGGNVDVQHAFDGEESGRVFALGAAALGREFQMLRRTSAAKQQFSDFIRCRIDDGFPVIALGIIGPPEACLITGYRDGGDTLIGWNLFQDYPEYNVGIAFEPSGYFVTSKWWENTDTIALIGIGAQTGTGLTLKEVLQNAIAVMTGRVSDGHVKGLMAYDAWQASLSDESQFPKEAIFPILAERLMCHGDAVDCLSDGLYRAHTYFKRLSETRQEHSPLLSQIAAHFEKASGCIMPMIQRLGGFERGEAEMRELAKPEARKDICALIGQCKGHVQRAYGCMKELYRLL